jgi:Tfp pilus assembly protein PilF
MKTKLLSRVALSSLAMTLVVVGCKPAGKSHVASASARGPSSAKAAAQFAAMGETALRRRDGAGAVALSERAVASAPQEARYRAQLGQSYLLADVSNRRSPAFQEAVTLAPNDGRSLVTMAARAGGDRPHGRCRRDHRAGAWEDRRGRSWPGDGAER